LPRSIPSHADDLGDLHPALLTDTVGFIQKLPTQLVAAFRATLEELADASVLLHVVDITHPDAAHQSQTVEETLRDLGLADKPRVTALNKVDQIPDADGRPARSLDELRTFQGALTANIPGAVLISSEKRWGIDLLKQRLIEVLAERNQRLEIRRRIGRQRPLARSRRTGTGCQLELAAQSPSSVL
jgi:GTP-binding protein HflX